MQELKLVEDSKRREDLAQECRDLLDQAERIKDESRYQHSGDAVRRATSITARKGCSSSKPEKPETRRVLSTREKIILLEGSKLHGFVFSPWTAPPAPSEFELRFGESLYSYVVLIFNHIRTLVI